MDEIRHFDSQSDIYLGPIAISFVETMALRHLINKRCEDLEQEIWYGDHKDVKIMQIIAIVNAVIDLNQC